MSAAAMSDLLLLFNEHPQRSVVHNEIVCVYPLKNVCVCVCVCVRERERERERERKWVGELLSACITKLNTATVVQYKNLMHHRISLNGPRWDYLYPRLNFPSTWLQSITLESPPQMIPKAP